MLTVQSFICYMNAGKLICMACYLFAGRTCHGTAPPAFAEGQYRSYSLSLLSFINLYSATERSNPLMCL